MKKAGGDFAFAREAGGRFAFQGKVRIFERVQLLIVIHDNY